MTNEWELRYLEIVQLCLEINEQTSYCVHFDIAGHCAWTSIRICKAKEGIEANGANLYSSVIKEFEFMKNYGPDKVTEGRLMEISNELFDFLHNAQEVMKLEKRIKELKDE